MKKTEKMLILDLTKYDYIPSVPSVHESPSVKIFEFWTEKGERVNNLERIKHDTEKIVIKTKRGIQELKIPQNMQKNLLEYFKHQNKKFKNISCHALAYYMANGSMEKIVKYKFQKTEDFQIGDTILLGSFKKLFWKTIHIYSEHSAICLTENEEEYMFISKLGDNGKVVVTTLPELQKIYWVSKSCAKTIWKNE